MATVYSTATGRLCPECGQAWHTGKCSTQSGLIGDGRVRIRLETKARKGAGVTLITGLPMTAEDAKLLLKQLKQQCGVGGSFKDNHLELQGDQRNKVFSLLQSKEWDVKIAN